MKKKIAIISTVLIILMSGSIAQTKDGAGFPVPPANAKQLFYLQRTPNINTVIYELNYDDNNQLDTESPVHVFWIRYGEKGQREELSFIQRHFAYGIKTKLLSKDFYEMHIVAYKKRILYLKKDAANQYYVYTIIDNKEIKLDRIFLKINGGTFWSPNVEYVEFKGVDMKSGLHITAQMKI